MKASNSPICRREGGGERSLKPEYHDDMTMFDVPRLKGLIERHAHYTNSKLARDILDNWEVYLPKFVKIMPVDFRRALEESKADQPEGDVLRITGDTG